MLETLFGRTLMPMHKRCLDLATFRRGFSCTQHERNPDASGTECYASFCTQELH